MNERQIEMNKNKEELIGMLNAISLVSGHLAECFAKLTETEFTEEYHKMFENDLYSDEWKVNSNEKTDIS